MFVNHRCFLEEDCRIQGGFTYSELILIFSNGGYTRTYIIYNKGIINNFKCLNYVLFVFYLAVMELLCPSCLFVQLQWETFPSEISARENQREHFRSCACFKFGSALATNFRGTNMKSVDLRIRPVDQLLWLIAPFHHQSVYLHDILITWTRNALEKCLLKTNKHFFLKPWLQDLKKSFLAHFVFQIDSRSADLERSVSRSRVAPHAWRRSPPCWRAENWSQKSCRNFA